MATMTLRDNRLQVHFTRWEKLAGLVRDLDVPVDQVRGVDVLPDGLAAARGVRAPGLGLPGVRKIGTWRGRGSKTLVSVRRTQPAVSVELAGARFDRVLIGDDDAEAVAQRIGAVVG